MTHLKAADLPWIDLGGGVRRKIIAHTPALMSVLVEFNLGAVGVVHQHEIHTQISYVAAGSLEVEIDSVNKVLKEGDSFIALPGVLHGVRALEPLSRLLDVFTPRRDDFL